VHVLFDNDLIRLEEHPDDEFLVLTRKPLQAHPTDVITALHAVIAAARPEHRAWALIVDLRQLGTGIHDDAFDGGMAEVHKRTQACFGRQVFLVRTAAGELQIRRTAGRNSVVTRDEEQAFELARRREP
jgi:hypothetical protein